jgi:Protein of unknown function (DUF3572)
MTDDWAEALALQALTHILADPDLCGRFLNLTGIDPGDLPSSVFDSHFLGAVLDFLLSDEPQLVEFCSAMQIDPHQPSRARRLLQGASAQEWD